MNIKDTNPFFYKTASNISIITLHGYLESCYSMSYFNQVFQDHKFNVQSPNLSGHAGKYSDLHNVKYQDWINQVENLYKEINPGNKIFIIGHSLGGMLALYMAQLYNLSGLIVINPLFDKLPLSMMMTPIGKYFIKYVPNLKPDIKNKHQIFAYDKISSWNTSEIIKLSYLTRKNINKIKCPILIFKSINDHRVNRENSERIMQNISSKKKVIIDLYNSYHIAPMDYEKEFIIDMIVKFINEVK